MLMSVRNIAEEEDIGFETLNTYRFRMRAIRALIPLDDRIGPREAREARDSLRKLKGEINRSCLFNRTLRGQQSMSDFERALLAPALESLQMQLRHVHLGTRPGPKWHAELIRAEQIASETLDRMRHSRGQRPGSGGASGTRFHTITEV
jgi:hypothetical protein